MLREWFIKRHGGGEAHQADVYRCMGCGGLLTHKNITAGAVCCAGRVAPTNPSYWEIFKLFVLPWSFYVGRSKATTD